MAANWRAGFFLQARSDFDVLTLLLQQSNVPACHKLHYLQMVTEKLAKGFASDGGPVPQIHQVFARFVQTASSVPGLGSAGRMERGQMRAYLKALAPVANHLEHVAPALAAGGPSAEYPWAAGQKVIAPEEKSMERTVWRVHVGDEETSASNDVAAGPLATTLVVLGHGASTNREHGGMERLATALVSVGLSVVRFNFLYTEKKKGPPDRMPRLMECFSAVADHARRNASPARLIIGGHSMGGRAASMMAADGFSCDGLLLLAYPLHPAGQPEKLRDAHLPSIPVPTLCMNGTRDELCTRSLMDGIVTTLPATFSMHWLEGADHGFHVQKRSGRTDEDVMVEVGRTARDWVSRL